MILALSSLLWSPVSRLNENALCVIIQNSDKSQNASPILLPCVMSSPVHFFKRTQRPVSKEEAQLFPRSRNHVLLSRLPSSHKSSIIGHWVQVSILQPLSLPSHGCVQLLPSVPLLWVCEHMWVSGPAACSSSKQSRDLTNK